MSSPRPTSLEPISGPARHSEGSVEPSSLAGSLPRATAASSLPDKEAIPNDQVPAASPLPDDRRERSARAARRLWWPVLLFVAICAAIAVVAAVSNGPDRGVRGPADQGAPGAPRQEKVPPSSPNAAVSAQ
jgi:hypothetical protein